MTRHPGFPVDEIRGRMLHEQLLAEGRSEFEKWAATSLPPECNSPEFPVISFTDTGTMRAVIVAS